MPFFKKTFFSPDTDKASKSIETVKNLLGYLSFSFPIIKRHPGDKISVEFPLIYNGYALDRVHYDPISNIFLPKGLPHLHKAMELNDELINKIKADAEQLLRNVWVVDAVEAREPEGVWVVPLAWNKFIIAHIKVDLEGEEIVPDYGLTEEIKRYAI